MEKVGNYQGLHALLEEFRSLNGPRFSSGSLNFTAPCDTDTLDFQQTADSSTDVPHVNERLGLDFRVYPFEYLPDPDQTFPELASELVNAQEAQFSELHSKEAAALKLKEELQKEKEHLSAIQRQITSTTKAICLAKDEAVATGAECALFQKEIESKASIIEGHRLKLRRHKQARMSLESLSIKYRERMAKHGTRTEEVEQKSAVQQELEAATDKVIKLREKKLVYLSGEGAAIFEGQKQEALLDQKAKMDATRELLEEENANLQYKLASGNVQLEQIRTELGLAKKKQQAQVTRLRRQLQEAQARRRQWVEKADQLRGSIRQFKLKMEE